jgi:hypothetical protein
MDAKEEIAMQDSASLKSKLEIEGPVDSGLLKRILRAIRSKVRLLFKKKDPDIYPFF